MWISKEEYLRRTGFSEGRLRGWIARKWTRGIHYQVQGNTTAINLEAVNEWWASAGQQESDPTGKASRSGSTGKTDPNTQKQSKATSITKLTSRLQ